MGLQTSFQTFFLGGWGEGDGVPVARSHRLDVPQRGQIPTRPCHPVAPAGGRSRFLLLSPCLPARKFRAPESPAGRRGEGQAGSPCSPRVAIPSPGHLAQALGPSAGSARCCGPKSQPASVLGFPRQKHRVADLWGWVLPQSPEKSFWDAWCTQSCPLASVFIGHPWPARLTRPRCLPGWPSPASNCWWVLGDLKGHNGLAGCEAIIRVKSNATPSPELRVMGSAAGAGWM